MIKIVIDTNVFISGFLWKGNPAEIFDLARRGEIKICVSEEIIEELARVLGYPKFRSRLRSIEKTSEQIIEEFLEIVKLYPSEKLPQPVIIEDPPDDKFLACAVSCQALFIVSGDKHLLQLKEFQDILIVSPKEFLNIIKKQYGKNKKRNY